MQAVIPINKSVLQFCNLTATELMGRVKVLDNYFGATSFTKVLQRGIRDIGTVSLLCERSVVAQSLATTTGFQRVVGNIAAHPDFSLSAPGDCWLQLGLGYILSNLGERIVFGGMENTRGTILLRDGRLSVECRGSLVEQTMRDIFIGHRNIVDVMSSRGCKGRWTIHIDRPYCDGQAIRELTEILRHTPVEHLPATTWPGISIVMTDEHQPAKRSRSAEQTPDKNSDTCRYPRSLMMHDSLSLLLEGPYFDQYALMEKFVVEAGEREGSCRLVAIDTDEFAGGIEAVKARLEALFQSRRLAHVAAVLLVQTEREGRGTTFTIEALFNPGSVQVIPEDFSRLLTGRHKIFY
jgi:hypothetical protein